MNLRDFGESLSTVVPECKANGQQQSDPYFLCMDKPVIVFDGECRFCQWSVGRIRKLDRAGLFELVPRQTPGVDERFPVLTNSDFNTGLRLLRTDTEVDVGADAIYQIYRRLPPYHLVAWIYRLPIFGALSRAGYGLIARNRHRFGRVECDTGSCVVPAAAPES